MARVFWEFWLFLIPGAVISRLISVIAHNLMGIAQGVPLARFGIAGTVAQISLLLLPYVVSASLTAVFYFRRHRRLKTGHEIAKCAKMIGLTVFALTILFFALSGAWFGLIQAPGWMITIVLFAPALSAAVLFWFAFPNTIRLIDFWKSLS